MLVSRILVQANVMEKSRTKYLSVVGFLSILIAAVYIGNSVLTTNFSHSILAPIRFVSTTNAVDTLGARYRRECPTHRFKSVKIVSRKPDIMIIDEFLTPEEANVLIGAAYFPSLLRNG